MRRMEANGYFLLGLAALADACNALRKSRLMLASNFLVGTRFNASRFCFASNGELQMTLIDVINLFDTDERCRELLVRLRWPNGPECPRCKMPAVELATAKQLFYCKGCDYQFTVMSGTVFNDSHLPLQKWFLATLLLCESRKGHSANQLKRELGVSYKTAWYLCHRIRYAMTEVHKMLDGTIEVDETYIGGRAKGAGTGNYRDTKEVVIGIIQRDGDLKFIHVKEGTSKAIREVMEQHVSEDVDVIVTDESVLYPSGLPKSQRSE